jgi:hypothetical protein
MDEFVPQSTSAYIRQHDVHIGEMTVRETLAFAARCQGVGTRYGMYGYVTSHTWTWSYERKGLLLSEYVTDMLTELSRREKHAKIKPDPDIDVYMKVECH